VLPISGDIRRRLHARVNALRKTVLRRIEYDSRVDRAQNYQVPVFGAYTLECFYPTIGVREVAYCSATPRARITRGLGVNNRSVVMSVRPELWQDV